MQSASSSCHEIHLLSLTKSVVNTGCFWSINTQNNMAEVRVCCSKVYKPFRSKSVVQGRFERGFRVCLLYVTR